MAHPEFTLRQLLEAGVHFGHKTQRWNPLMEPFIHSRRNGVHIIDLTQTVSMLDASLIALSDVAAQGGRILFVGTKRQAQVPIAEAAERCAQYFINQRWLGGTLTNWKTVSNSIERLNSIELRLEEGVEGLTKKERLGLERERAKLFGSLGGIRKMNGLPDILFVIDVNKEAIAIKEAVKLSIPVIAVVDTNCSPDGITHLIPGNDDASRSIALYCDLAAKAVLDGVDRRLRSQGFDLGEGEDGPPGSEPKEQAKKTKPKTNADDGQDDASSNETSGGTTKGATTIDADADATEASDSQADDTKGATETAQSAADDTGEATETPQSGADDTNEATETSQSGADDVKEAAETPHPGPDDGVDATESDEGSQSAGKVSDGQAASVAPSVDDTETDGQESAAAPGQREQDGGDGKEDTVIAEESASDEPKTQPKDS